jgi:peptide/nickel transport system substrate-binding protein/oligopeptide transport system substrate-binding protein
MNNEFSRRQFLRGLGLASTGAFLVACTPAATTTTGGDEAPAGAAAPETKLVNALGVELPADALPLDEQYRLIQLGRPGEQAGGSFGHEMESLYNRAYPLGYGSEVLTKLDKEKNVVGIGCESWQQSEDGLYWDFKLRPDLQFSDGAPITAEDWVWTFRRSFSNAYDFGWFFGDILNASEVLSGEMPPEELGMEAVDELTLRIYTAAPVPYVPALGVWAFVAPKQAYEQYGDNWSVEPDHYIASGPWKLVEFERGVSWGWELNPEYKGVNRPYYTQLRGRTLPEGLPAYIAGDIQQHAVSIDTPAAELGIIEENPILKEEMHPQPSVVTWYIGFNTMGEFAPLADQKVRLALSKAIDKEKIIAEVGRGFAYAASGVVPKGFPGNSYDALWEAEPNIFDPEAARQLLAEAGFADGEGFPAYELWIRAPVPYMVTLCEAVQAAWKEHLNINVQLYPTDHQSFTAATFTEKTVPIYFVGYSLDYYDPATFLGVFRSGGRHPHDSAVYDETYNAGNALRDPAERFAKLAEAERILVDEVGYIFLIQPFTINLWPCNLAGEGLEPNAAGFQSDQGYGGGANSWVGAYWSNSSCRAGLA